MNVHDFSVKATNGKPISLSDYAGKVLLIVNTATKCGLTPQYKELQALYDTYRDQGFEILDFPSNQFLKQAPGTDSEISEFCTLNYGTTFPRFAKIDVNGKHADPLFVALKEQLREELGDETSASFGRKVKVLTPFGKKGDITWNFGKFLIDRKGVPIARYAPGYAPEKLKADIERLLGAPTE
ncbi:MAG: glutathione peroxidase [Raoultibacter sp.]